MRFSFSRSPLLASLFKLFVCIGFTLTSASGKSWCTIMSALAEMERGLIVERTLAGLAEAREKGRIGGRRPKLTPEQWAQAGRLIANGEDRKQVAIIYDVAVCTLYKKFPAR